MQPGPLTIAVSAFFAVLGVTEGARMLAPDAEIPPVAISEIRIDGAVVTYTRRVNATDVIRAPFFSDMVDEETELSVPECELAGRADYGPAEPQTQTWHIDQFFGPGCTAALVPGRSYAAVATVSPSEGPASVKRSEPFVWSGVQ